MEPVCGKIGVATYLNVRLPCSPPWLHAFCLSDRPGEFAKARKFHPWPHRSSSSIPTARIHRCPPRLTDGLEIDRFKRPLRRLALGCGEAWQAGYAETLYLRAGLEFVQLTPRPSTAATIKEPSLSPVLLVFMASPRAITDSSFRWPIQARSSLPTGSRRGLGLFKRHTGPQARMATTSRYSAATTVSSAPPRLYSDHNPSSSSRNLLAESSFSEANARFVGP
jgi:hypothetical protein